MNREIAGIAPQEVADGKTDLPGHFRGASPALHGQRVIGRLRKALQHKRLHEVPAGKFNFRFHLWV